jgi:hypothetical protein
MAPMYAATGRIPGVIANQYGARSIDVGSVVTQLQNEKETQTETEGRK